MEIAGNLDMVKSAQKVAQLLFKLAAVKSKAEAIKNIPGTLAVGAFDMVKSALSLT